jgi:hypothetical protein
MIYEPVEFDKRALKATGLYAPNNKDNAMRNDLLYYWGRYTGAITRRIQQYCASKKCPLNFSR